MCWLDHNFTDCLSHLSLNGGSLFDFMVNNNNRATTTTKASKAGLASASVGAMAGAAAVAASVMLLNAPASKTGHDKL
eukprot:6427332-Amphidinium_carterae.1